MIVIQQTGGPAVSVQVQAWNPATPTRDTLDGFVEANHFVSMEAEHFTGESLVASARWVRLPDFGETLSGMTGFPVTAASLLPPQPAPALTYRMYLTDSGRCSVEAVLAPTLDFVPGRGLRYAISFDDQPPQVIDALADPSQHAWEKAVSDGVRKVTTECRVSAPGYHTLRFRMVDPGVVLEKLVIGFPDPQAGLFAPGRADQTGRSMVPASYLGPPESYHRIVSSSSEK